MRFIFLLLIFFVAQQLQAQVNKQYLAGGRFFGSITQSHHLQWGNLCDVEIKGDCEFMRSFRPLKNLNFITRLPKNSKRKNNLYCGANISFLGYWRNTEDFNMRDFAAGPGLLFKYYTPVNIFMQALAGLEYEKTRIWEPVPQQNSLYIPKSHTIGFEYELFIGYSFQLQNRVLFEPCISYKVSKNNTYLSVYEKYYLPEESVNIYLGFLFILK
jgi:hypothetical protein